jgi:hypothetical protein
MAGVGSVTDLTTERPAGLPEPDAVPDVSGRDGGPPVEPAPVLAVGVQVTRLLALVRLTAPQALELGTALLTGATESGDPVLPDRAIVSTTGEVVLHPAADGGTDGRPVAGRTGTALTAVLAEVARSARLRGRPPDPEAELLLTELDRAAADLPDAGVPAVAARLRETADAIDRTVVRGELAALVRAVGDRSASAGGSAAAVLPSAAGRAAQARRVAKKERRTAVRRIGAWLLSLVVLAAVVVGEVALLRDDISADVGLLLDAGRSGSESSTAPKPDGVPIVPPAPASAGSVAAVDLRPLAQCVPAAPCTLRLQVGLVPGPEPQVVIWSYRIFDRCTGAATDVPGGTVTAPAGGQRVAAIGTVALPAQQAVAVVAVTGVPAAAASAPVFAGSCLPAEPTG